MSYKNCQWCPWMGEVHDGCYPDCLRCESCLSPWDATEKYQRPPSTPYRPKKEYE